MPHYIISDDQIKKVITNFRRSNNLSSSEIKLKQSHRNLVANFFNTFAADGDGEFTPFSALLPQIKRFAELPLSIEIPDTLLSTFIDEVKKIDIKTHFPTHELALRLYFGHEKGVTPSANKYGIVIVPICSPKIVTGTMRDHLLDLENQLLTKHGKFFALVISDDKGKLITTDKSFCKDVCKNKDAQTATELAYFSFEQIIKFRDGITRPKDRMSFTFCRNASNAITGFISFLGTQGELLESEIISGVISATGTFFDQGDLIPPPSPVSDVSF